MVHTAQLSGALKGSRVMTEERPALTNRRLSAISADVAGYSRLMHRDEEATYAKFNMLMTDAITPAIAGHGGRIVKSTGDGFLAEFNSAVGAVRAAVQFQNHVRELTADDTDDTRMQFRVGINLGDVIVEPHDIFGDDVNIAARLESIAEPGEICLSSSVHSHVSGKVAVEFADLGENNLKNIERPVQAYAIRYGGRPNTLRKLLTATAATARGKPCINASSRAIFEPVSLLSRLPPGKMRGPSCLRARAAIRPARSVSLPSDGCSEGPVSRARVHAAVPRATATRGPYTRYRFRLRFELRRTGRSSGQRSLR
jgi:class 3 adenylate cyclase